MTDAEKIREVIALMERHLTTTIMRSDGGTVKRIYLLLTDGVEYRLPPMPKRKSGPKEVITSAMIEKRFGLKV